ncbi:hypothetical protein EB796_009466 [Bugula neritina]|uniref:sn-1-specific diacylglycerol lipase n=1 Tax=Bugula neritina TaxID=10212 RepID=A0A7J7K219_BUGNE|nr:hypothetical protein EB796_009466 [Bugula neritina]
MPGLVVFNRRWSIGSDDLPVPAMILVFLNSVWVIALVSMVIEVHMTDGWRGDCSGGFLWYPIMTIGLLALLTVNDVFIAVQSAKGGVFDKKARHNIPVLLYIRTALLVVETIWACSGCVLLNWKLRTSQCDSSDLVYTLLCVVVGSNMLAELFTKFQNLQQNSADNSTSSEPTLRKLRDLHEEKWTSRVTAGFCCAALRKPSDKAVFNKIAILLADYFDNLDVVLSDFIAGMFLLRKQQKSAHADTVQQPTNDIYQYLSGMAISPRTKFLTLKDENMQSEFTCMLHFAEYALAAYGYQGQYFFYPAKACCRINICGRCRGCPSRQDERILVGDNCCQCQYAAITTCSPLSSEDDFIYGNYENKPNFPSYFVCLDHTYKKVVLCIRGTLSIRDALIDLQGDSTKLDDIHPSWKGHRSCDIVAVCCLIVAVCCLIVTVCCLIVAVCCLIVAVCCFIVAVCCLIVAVCCLIVAVCCFIVPVCCLVVAVCCLIVTVCCLIVAVCCLIVTVCCFIVAVCCLIVAVCCLIVAVCCLIVPVCCLVVAVCCLIVTVCCLIVTVCCLIVAVCCLIVTVCCLIVAVCCLIVTVCCLIVNVCCLIVNVCCLIGMVAAADNIFAELTEHQILESAFDRCPTSGYSLLVTGHSLGAGVAPIISFRLREKYPHLYCYAFSPPGGLLSLDAMNESREFTTSIVVGKDIIPRLGLPQLEYFRSDILSLLENSSTPKWRIFTSTLPLLGRCLEYQNTADLPISRSQNYSPFFTRTLSSTHEPMFMPGRVLHIVKNYPREKPKGSPLYQAVWADNSSFDTIIVSPSMLEDHLPNNVLEAMQKVVENHGPKKPEKMLSEEERRATLRCGDGEVISTGTEADRLI